MPSAAAENRNELRHFGRRRVRVWDAQPDLRPAKRRLAAAVHELNLTFRRGSRPSVTRRAPVRPRVRLIGVVQRRSCRDRRSIAPSSSANNPACAAHTSALAAADDFLQAQRRRLYVRGVRGRHARRQTAVRAPRIAADHAAQAARGGGTTPGVREGGLQRDAGADLFDPARQHWEPPSVRDAGSDRRRRARQRCRGKRELVDVDGLPKDIGRLGGRARSHTPSKHTCSSSPVNASAAAVPGRRLRGSRRGDGRLSLCSPPRRSRRTSTRV